MDSNVRIATLEQLDGDRWPPPTDPTGLIENVHRLRHVPIGDLTDDDLRELLGQDVGTEWLAALAIERLEEEPLAGDMYPGDLLRALLHATRDGQFWNRHPDELIRLWNVRTSLEEIRDAATKMLTDKPWPAFG